MISRAPERIFIAGGYGVVGGTLAAMLRTTFPEAALILGGRSPQAGQELARKLGNATVIALDLIRDPVPDSLADADLIIRVAPDPRHALGEFAIRHQISFIDITTGTADGFSPLLSLVKKHAPNAAVVPLGYYEAGMLLPLVDKLQAEFAEVTRVVMTALNDPEDPLGKISLDELGCEIPPALVRENGFWTYSAAPGEILLRSGERAATQPFTVLDVSAASAMTGAADVRMEVAFGVSEGRRLSGRASLDLYVDMEGRSASGEMQRRRIVASDPQGQAHFTSLGVVTVIQALLKTGATGFIAPEEVVDMAAAFADMQRAGVIIHQ